MRCRRRPRRKMLRPKPVCSTSRSTISDLVSAFGLKNPEAHSEFPRSVCVRVVSNVRIVKTEGNRAHVEAVFVTYRSKNEITDIFPGHHRYILETRDDGLRIVSKRSTLALNNLRPQGRVSIIL